MASTWSHSQHILIGVGVIVYQLWGISVNLAQLVTSTCRADCTTGGTSHYALFCLWTPYNATSGPREKTGSLKRFA